MNINKNYGVTNIMWPFCDILLKNKKVRSKWKKDADSPVLFFIDDLANKCVDINNDGKIKPEEDWGYAGIDENGAFYFLEKEILSVNYKIKTTFFVPVGKRANVIIDSEIKSISEPINATNKSKKFFKTFHNDERFEIAYHGTTHGVPGKTAKDFIQEWESYKSLDEALTTINRGKEIYRDAIGVFPNGGKYCGYISNEFSDESIDKSGFKWWCRYYNRAAVDGCNETKFCGRDKDSFYSFNVKFFGKNKVVDIPTTISGNLLNSVFRPSKGIKGILKKILKPLIIRWKLRKIDFLLKNNLVISIQEHISPSREDGKRQTPNIFDDKESLKFIFEYLKKKNVWYCTGSELAEWVKGKKNVY